MPFNINEFKSQLVGGGTRPSLFQVQITNPILGAADFKIPFMVKTASIPSSTLGEYTIPYFGRLVKYAGDRQFEPWSVVVINDEDFAVRNAMESWSNSINSHISNTRSLPIDYKSDAIVTQYGKDGTVLRVYNFQGMFPTQISEMAVGWDMSDQVQEFSVTFQYDLWTIAGGVTGNSTS